MSSPPPSAHDDLASTGHLAELQQRTHLPSFARTESRDVQPGLSPKSSRTAKADAAPQSGPKVDEALVQSLLEDQADDEDHTRGGIGADDVDQAHQDASHVSADTQSGPSRSPPTFRRRASSGRSGDASYEARMAKKRMTIMVDGEMPEGGEESAEEDADDDDDDDEDQDDLAEHDAEDEAVDSGVRPVEVTEQDAVDEQDAIVDDGDGGQADTSQPSTPGEGMDTSPLSPVASPSTQRKTSDAAMTASQRLPSLFASIHQEHVDEESIAKGEASTAKAEKKAVESGEGGGIAHHEEEEDLLDDEEEEEEEPSLKYSRLKGSATDILAKDTASALAVCDRFLALGTHAGMVFILDDQGNLIKGFRSHSASILDLHIDSSNEFVASAGMDGYVSISALSTSEQYAFDFKRVMRTVALEPGFGRKSTRSFVCGGMAGSLILKEKSWFGHKDVILHQGEGPIWCTRWRGSLIAWANDKGVRIYDTASRQRITFITPPSPGVRADLTRCSLWWQDDRTLLIAWADHIKIARIRERKKTTSAAAASLAAAASTGSTPQLFVEISAIFQLDCMISGIAPYGEHFLVLAYITEDAYDAEAGADQEDRYAQRRRESHRPELRIISNEGEEMSSDVLSLQSFARFQCNDYLLVPSPGGSIAGPSAVSKTGGSKAATAAAAAVSDEAFFYVVSPKDVVVARPRDEKDHINWLLEKKRYEDALSRVEAMGAKARAAGFDAAEIGRKYLAWLVEDQRDYAKAARSAAAILGQSVQAWEDWVFLFVERGKLGVVIPYIPTSEPTLSGLVYDMILAHFLRYDHARLLRTIKEWPTGIFNAQAVVLAVEDQLEREQGTPRGAANAPLLMECLVELFLANRQPGKALPYFLRLRRPGVFDLIREHNLFTAVQDQAVLLIEFDDDLERKRQETENGVQPVDKDLAEAEAAAKPRDPSLPKHGQAIELLVDHTHSIPINRVVAQLQSHPRYLYRYLDALFDRDAQQVVEFADLQVGLYAEYEYERLMPYLRTMSSYYSFEKAYKVCKELDYVPEMVFLLGRVGDNKQALSLIIERLADVERAIDFAKEQNDDDLWEDLLRYSETKPAFIRGLLENVGAEVDPVKLIRRIKNGLEIPGLKPALMKILSDFNLQVSLLEGCAAILNHDGRSLSQLLHLSQSQARFFHAASECTACGQALFASQTNVMGTFESARQAPSPTIVFLCRHKYHLNCLVPAANIPKPRPSENLGGGGGKEKGVQGAPHLPTVVMSASSAHARAVARRTLGISAFGGDGGAELIGGGGGKGGGGGGTDFSELPYAPQRRAEERRRALTSKIGAENRLKVVLRAGCPACRKLAEDRL